MQLWSGLLSPFSAKVRIVLAEKNLEYQILEVPWSRKTLWGPKPADFLAVSPRGEVPVLIDGELAIYDSTVIDEYLEERHPQPPLMPVDPADRARCRQLEDEADQAMKTHVTTLVQEVFNKPDESTRDAARIAEARQALERYFEGLDKQLAGREHLCGAFGVADIASFMVVGFAAAMGAPPDPGLATLGAWVDRVRARPSVGTEFEAMIRAAAAV